MLSAIFLFSLPFGVAIAVTIALMRVKGLFDYAKVSRRKKVETLNNLKYLGI